MKLATRLTLILIAVLLGCMGILALYLWPYRDTVAHGTLLFLLGLGGLILVAGVLGVGMLASKLLHLIGKGLHGFTNGILDVAERHQALRHAEDKHQFALRESFLNQETILVRPGESLFTRGYHHQIQAHHLAQLPSGNRKPDEEPLTRALLPQAPPFAQMKHLIQPGRFPLAWGIDGPIMGDVTDLLSMLFVGKPGRGKSVGLLYYVGMLLLAHATIWIFDPQGSLIELNGVLNYRDSMTDILDAVPLIEAERQERDRLWRAGKRKNGVVDKEPFLVLIDELPLMAAWVAKNKAAHDIFSLIQSLVTECRKYNMYCIIAGQGVPATVLPTLTRDNMSSRLVFFSSDLNARMSGLDAESREKLLPLLKGAKPGTAILDVSRRDEPDLAAIPLTTIEDIVALVNTATPEHRQDRHEEDDDLGVPARHDDEVIEASYRVIEEGPRHQQLPPAFYRQPVKLQGDLLTVYRAVVTYGTTNKRQIASKTGMDETRIYRSIQTLKESGYLKNDGSHSGSHGGSNRGSRSKSSGSRSKNG